MAAAVAVPDGDGRGLSASAVIERMDLTARGAGKRIHAIIVQEASGMRKSLMTRYKK
jgi:hypothetical protein